MASDTLTDQPSDVAVVTGARRGLGRALAVGLARRGISVAAIVRDTEVGFKGDKNGTCAPIQEFCADVSDPASVNAAIERAASKLGKPSILINNAAVFPHRDILDFSPAEYSSVLAINLGGAVACTAAVLPHMVALGKGHIINVGSFADISPQAMTSAYAVSKGALRVFTRTLVADLKDRYPDIIINDWIPGPMKTRMGRVDGQDPETVAEWGVTLAQMKAREWNGIVFAGNIEHRIPSGLKQRVRNAILGDKPSLRLDQTPSRH